MTAFLAVLRKWCWAATLASIAVGLAATLAFSWGTLGRPLNDSEGQVLFEASRIHRALPLYVDPVQGAFDYGPVPARYFVLYPPVMPWLVAFVPFLSGTIPLRVVDTLAWFGLLAFVAWRAKPGCRRAAWVGAALVGSVYAIAPFASSARPDPLALLLAGVALSRSVDRGRVDPLSAALFALAPWIKPNVIGLAAGAMLVDLVVRRGRALFAVGVALVVTGVLFVILERVSHGAFLTHLRLSTGQPLSLVQWKDQLPGRLQFFGLPIVFAAFCGFRRRHEPDVRLALGALVASSAWTLVSAAKIGSSACYWMEPCVAAVVVLARAPVPAPRAPWNLLAAAALLVQALWIDVASVRSTLEAMLGDVPAEERAVGGARAACGARDGEILLADDVGVELDLNGRITAQPFQMTHLVRAGLYPASAWVGDILRPEVVGVVVRNDLLERPITAVSIEYDRFGPDARRALTSRFRLASRSGDWRTYCARP